MSILYILVTPNPTYIFPRGTFSKDGNALFKKGQSFVYVLPIFGQYLLIFDKYFRGVGPLPGPLGARRDWG